MEIESLPFSVSCANPTFWQLSVPSEMENMDISDAIPMKMYSAL